MPNGLRVMLISNVKPGETVEPIDDDKTDEDIETESQWSDEGVFGSDLRKV